MTRTTTRNDSDIEWALLELSIDVPMDHIENWTEETARDVADWCAAMQAGNKTNALAIRPIPEPLTGYVMAYGPADRRRQSQSDESATRGSPDNERPTASHH